MLGGMNFFWYNGRNQNFLPPFLWLGSKGTEGWHHAAELGQKISVPYKSIIGVTSWWEAQGLLRILAWQF